MPQIAKGKDKRDVVVSTRFTKAQAEELARIYGKPARGVHAIVVASLRAAKK